MSAFQSLTFKTLDLKEGGLRDGGFIFLENWLSQKILYFDNLIINCLMIQMRNTLTNNQKHNKICMTFKFILLTTFEENIVQQNTTGLKMYSLSPHENNLVGRID